MNKNIFNIDFNRFITWLTPPRLRNNFILNWLKALISPIQTLYNDFTRFRNDIEYKMGINGQVCYITKILNDTFDTDERRIYLGETNNYIVQLIHTDAAQDPLKTYIEGTGFDDQIPVIHLNSSYVNSGYDFIVNVPFDLTDQQRVRMTSILNKYKLPSKRYDIYENN